MEDIAARAGTSKTVIYRHFGDRAGLYTAVVESVQAYIEEGLTAALQLSDPINLGRMTRDLADAYLALVERDPKIYQFVLNRPAEGPSGSVDPFRGLTGHLGARVAATIAQQLERNGADASCAGIWGHGVIGFIRAAADEWMASGAVAPRAQVVNQISTLFTPAFGGAMSPIPVDTKEQQ